MTIERPMFPPRAESVDSFSRRPAVLQRGPETALQTLRRLREEASAEIERLIAFLDATEPDPDMEPDDSGIGDFEGLYEQVGTQDWQQGAFA